MTNPMIRIHNSETNEVIDREMNAAELTAWENENAALQAETAALEAALIAKAALLTKLGITEDEARLLLG